MTFDEWKLTTDPRFKYREATQAEYDSEERLGIMGFKENYPQTKALHLNQRIIRGDIDLGKADAELLRIDRSYERRLA